MTGLLSGAMLMGGAYAGGVPQFNTPQLSQPYGGGFSQNPAIIMQGLPGQGLPAGIGMPFPCSGGLPFYMQQGPQTPMHLPYPPAYQGGGRYPGPRGSNHYDRHDREDRDTQSDERHQWRGTVQSVSATSSNFTMKHRSRSYLVSVTPATTLRDRSGAPLSNISSFQSGDVMIVQGTSSASSIAAGSVVNTSLPR